MSVYPAAARTVGQLRSDLTSRRDAAVARQAAADLETRSIASTASAAGRSNLTAAEDARVTGLLSARDAARAELTSLDAQLAECGAAEAEEADYQAAARSVRPTRAARMRPHYDEVARVGAEARTYNPETDRTGREFLLDVARQFLYSDPAAQSRLVRHMAEERIERPGPWQQRAAGDSTTTNWAGLTVPQYLTDLYAPAIAALRPLVDHAQQHDLPPSGMTINISRVTTASTAAIQGTELTGVSATSLDDTLLTINVLTAAGQQTLSRQAIDRGTGIEDVTVQDLMRRVATTMDSAIINTATTGLLATGQTTTYTDASPTPQLLWPNIFKAQSLLEQALLGVATPDMVVMHPRRLNWFVSTLGSTWPLIGGGGQNGPQSGGVVVSNEYGAAVRLILPNGLKVIADANLPTNLGAGTNQDPILVCASGELHVWTDKAAPILIRAEQPAAANLGVLLVAYSYFAASPGTGLGRYTSNPGIINGTGTIAPSGF